MVWTNEKVQQLIDLYPCWSCKEIAVRIGATAKAVKSKAKVIGITKRKPWTVEEIEYVRTNYSNINTADIAKHLNKTMSSVFACAGKLGLHKSEEFRNSPLSGRLRPGSNIGGVTRFKPGSTPMNKGKLQHEFMTQDAIERTKATRFQKGAVPANTKHDGCISVRHNYKRNIKSVWIRVAMGKWRELHRMVWEQTMGPIPKGFNVQFKDKNPLNCEPSNLYLINRHNQIQQNTIHRYPEEIKRAIRQLASFKRKLKKYEKQD